MQTPPLPNNEKLRLDALKRYGVLDTDFEKEYNRAVEKQSAYQKAILDNAALMIIATTLDGTITSFNPAAEKSLGYQAEELIGKCSPAVFHDQAEIAERARQMTQEFGETIPIGFEVFIYKTLKNLRNADEWTYIRKNGEAFPVHLSISAIHNEGEIIGFLGIAEDISEQKAREDLIRLQNKSLNEKQQKLKTLIAQNEAIMAALNKSTLVSITDLQGNIEAVNTKFCQVSGYTEAELLGQNHRIVNSGIHAKAFWAKMWKTITKGKTWHAEVCNRSKNGELYWVDTVINPIFDEKGKVYQYFSIRTLVTQRKKAELQIQEQNEKLVVSEKELKQNLGELLSVQKQLKEEKELLSQSRLQFQSLIENMQGVAYRCQYDKDWTILYISPQIEEISGYPANDFLENIRTYESVIHPQDSAFVAEKVTEAIEQGQYWEIEYRILHHNGAVRWVHEKGKDVRNQYGDILYLDGFILDISKNKEQEQIIIEQNRSLERKVQERTLTLERSFDTVAKQKNSIMASINYALRIQNAIIPKETELQKHFDCFVFFRPRDVVSGDFYWFADKGDKKIIALADCTGHGVSGAFMTMIANNILNQLVHDYEVYQPNEILNKMPIFLEKTLLHSEGTIRDGMDIAIVTISQNPADARQQNPQREIAYAGAKMPIYCYQNGQLDKLNVDPTSISPKKIENYYYNPFSLQTKESCILYLCSDGFQDQFGGAEDTKFMTKNFIKLLLGIADKPMKDQKILLDDAFDEWKGERKQTDDILVLGIRL